MTPRELLSGSRRDDIVLHTVTVMVNDETRALPDGATVADLVATLCLGARRIAVEVNRMVVPRAEYPSTTLRDGDVIEVIHFVGGG